MFAMKPVAIFRHSPTEDAGYFAIFLERHGLPWQLISIDRGEAVPASVEAFSGLCLMGGSMSVNDPLPWIAPLLDLVREADARGLPVIGHCLGGQLIAKAFGGTVARNPVAEVGWLDIQGRDDGQARRWLGNFAGKTARVFHWHGETFSLPENANLLASSEACAHQIFAYRQHLAMQCHIEMLPEMVRRWCEHWADMLPANTARPDSIQPVESILAGIPVYLPAMRCLADHLYGLWCQGLPR
jgi:GMP synthase-like glutamine amidotransferase